MITPYVEFTKPGYHQEPTLENLQHDIYLLTQGLSQCIECMEHLTCITEVYVNEQLEEQAKKLYKILINTKRIDVSEEEFMKMLKDDD